LKYSVIHFAIKPFDKYKTYDIKWLRKEIVDFNGSWWGGQGKPW
jgi:hypothetical protein